MTLLCIGAPSILAIQGRLFKFMHASTFPSASEKRVVLPFDTQLRQGFAGAQACERKSDYDLTVYGECTSHAAGCMARQPIVLLGLNFRRG